MNIRRASIQLTLLTLSSLGICCLIFLSDHETSGWQDLLLAQNAPAFLIFGLPLMAFMVALSMLLGKGHRVAFSFLAAATTLALGALLWQSFSHAPTELGQLRNFILLSAIAGSLITGAVLACHGISRKLAGRKP